MSSALLLLGCSGAGGAELLGIEMTGMDGEPKTLAAVDGVAVVNFWASWCKPCVKEMPMLQDVADENPEVRFIGINVVDEPEKVQKMVAQTGVRYEIWLDTNGDAMVTAGVRSLPGTLVVVDGEVVFTKLGEITRDELVNEISQTS